MHHTLTSSLEKHQKKHTRKICKAKIHSIINEDAGQARPTCLQLQCESKIPPPRGLVKIFPKRLGIFQPNFTCLLCVPIYATLRIFIQLSATLTKLFHIKHDHPVHIMCAKCPPSAKTHFLTFFPNS